MSATWPPPGSPSATSTTSCAPTCTATTSAGIRRLENGRWVPTFPKREIPVRRPRARSLDREARGGPGRLALDHRFGAADRRREPRRDRQKRPSARRSRAPDADAGPHHRSLLGRGRPARCRRDHHRRRDPLADPDAYPGGGMFADYNTKLGGAKPPQAARALLRHLRHCSARALRLALDRPHRGRGRRFPLRRGHEPRAGE